MNTPIPTALVTEIPLPWKHPYGTVVAVEYPADRPNVVDLVLASGHRTAETRTARYARKRSGVWDIARFVAAADAAENAPVPQFGETETITIREVEVGDFVVAIPDQQRVRGTVVNSAVTAIREDWETWTIRRAGRRVMDVPSRALTHANRTSTNYPLDFEVQVRRPIR